MPSILSALFRGEDELSPVFGNIAQNAETASGAVASVGSTASGTARSLDDVTSSGNALSGTTQNISSNVADVTGNLEDMGNTAQSAGNDTTDAIGGIRNALVAAGIAKLLHQATSAVIDMANEFSNAESIIIRSTGATGAELNGLSSSMMNVFSGVPESIDAVATTLATLNTATGATGAGLEFLTEKALTFARVNNEDAAASTATLGRLMNALELDANGLATTMDQLTLASQMSGLGVNALAGYVIDAGPSFEEMGFSLERSIALFASFYQAGAEPRELLSSLNILLNRMAQSGATNAEQAFSELLDSIKEAPDILSATTIASEAFGARVGAKVADDIRAGRFEIDMWVDAISNADGTLASAGEAALTLEEQWAQASNSISAAFKGILAPAVGSVSEGFAKTVQNIGDFLNQNPIVSVSITALGVGLGVATASVLAFAAAKAIATTSMGAFAAAAAAAYWPLLLIVGAVAAVATGIALLSRNTNQADEEFRALTASSRQQYMEIQRLNDEHERAIAQYGEGSAQARALAEDIAGQTAAFEASRRTTEEFNAGIDAAIERQQQISIAFENAVEEITAEAEAADLLIGKLARLANQTDLTAGEQLQMEAIVGQLNQMFPELSLSVESLTGACVANAQIFAEIHEQQQMVVAISDAYIANLEQERILIDKVNDSYNEYVAARQLHDEMLDHLETYGFYEDFDLFVQTTYEMENLAATNIALNEELAQTREFLADNRDAFEEAAEAIQLAEEAAANMAITYDQAVNTAIDSVVDSLLELAEAYDAAYDAARRSLEGTFGLFEVAEERAGISSQAIIDAWESQIEFFESYNENLQFLNSMDINTDFLAQLSDGSQQSMGQVAALKEELEGLSPEDAAARIAEINSTFENLSEARDTTAETMAEIQIDMNSRLDEILGDMSSAVSDMDMSAEAGAAATATIDQYIANIRAGVETARAAATSVADAVVGALGSRAGGDGYATGTLHAPPGLAWVGEEGPELMSFQGGERVYPANESHRMATADAERIKHIEAPSAIAAPDSEGKQSTSRETLHKIEIDGSGVIEVKGVDKEEVWDAVEPKLKSAFFDILSEDIFEEGELAHAF